MMILGSHNSFSYAKVKPWYLRPFAFAARCQEVPWFEQYSKYGIRYFDLRIRFDKHGNPYCCHGIIKYMIDIQDLLFEIYAISSVQDPIYIRVIYEQNAGKISDKNRKLFIKFCAEIQSRYIDIIFQGGRLKSTWERLFEFEKPDLKVDDWYSSVTNVFGEKSYEKLAKIDDFYPKFWAKMYNKLHTKCADNYDVLLKDFVNI